MRMTESELLMEFERMLENMNLTEEKKHPLRSLPESKMREMLALHMRTNVTSKASRNYY